MGRLPVTAAVDIIKGAREKFNVEVETHSPCGLQGFYLTVKEPSQELTDYIVNEFKAKKQSLTSVTIRQPSSTNIIRILSIQTLPTTIITHVRNTQRLLTLSEAARKTKNTMS